jgi:phospholipid/cholesterol/gamma-HCH transport system substrate-binding protein
MKEADRRLAAIQKKVGLFILVAAVLAAAVIVYVGVRQGLFTPTAKIYFVAASGYDIVEGQAVKMSGFTIGKVNSISLENSAKVKVQLLVDSRYMKYVKVDSQVWLVKPGYIGGSVIVITPGSAGARNASGGAILSFHRQKSLTQIATELKNEVSPTFQDLKQIIAYINDPNGDVKKTIRNLDELSSGLLATRRRLDVLLVHADKDLSSASGNANAVAGSAKQTLASTNALIKRVDRKLPALLDKADRSLDNVQKTTEALREAAEKSAPRIPRLIDKASGLADDTRELTSSLKKTWPLRLYIKQPKEKKIKVDSFE